MVTTGAVTVMVLAPAEREVSAAAAAERVGSRVMVVAAVRGAWAAGTITVTVDAGCGVPGAGELGVGGVMKIVTSTVPPAALGVVIDDGGGTATKTVVVLVKLGVGVSMAWK